jgi:hypothetical protein
MSDPDPQPPQQKPNKLHFAKALGEAMRRANLSPSDVARLVWGTMTDKRGYEVARNRDRIGHYLKGVSFPEPENLQRLADAVGSSVEELTASPVGGETASGNLSGLPRRPPGYVPGQLLHFDLVTPRRKMRLQVDRYIDLKHYDKIVELIRILAEEPSDLEEVAK